MSSNKYITSVFINDKEYLFMDKTYLDIKIQFAHENGMMTAYKNMLKSINQQSGLQVVIMDTNKPEEYDQFLDDIEYDQELDVPKWQQIKVQVVIMDISETDKYKLDIKRTLIGNISYILYMIIIGIYIIISARFLGTFQSADIRLLGFIIYAFSIVSLIRGTYLPDLEYEPR